MMMAQLAYYLSALRCWLSHEMQRPQSIRPKITLFIFLWRWSLASLCAGKSADLWGLQLKSTWGLVLPSINAHRLCRFFFFFLLQELHYSKRVCFAVVQNTTTANTMFHRLEGTETSRSDDIQQHDKARSLFCLYVLLQHYMTWHGMIWHDIL